ncbi:MULTISPECIES: M3 family oligoendopeptidase [unclassified Helicobacter]|uniref:M3 family oligoendopeptidase n=1 Tax=unclassified Helicobacter TaxID=2593540 RepID=UPI0009EF3761|nr:MULTISPECIES: M3 family oligoendopeptidase [unclassified Helicobacter]
MSENQKKPLKSSTKTATKTSKTTSAKTISTKAKSAATPAKANAKSKAASAKVDSAKSASKSAKAGKKAESSAKAPAKASKTASTKSATKTTTKSPASHTRHTWNLKPLFASNKALESYTTETKTLVAKFEKRYAGKLKSLDSGAFLASLKEYENLIERISRVMTYAFLVFAEDTSKGGFYSGYESKCNEIYESLVFYELEFVGLDSALQKAFIKDSGAYSFFLQNLVAKKAHHLDLSAEKVLVATSSVGVGAFSRLFDEYLARLKIGAEQKSEEEILALLHHADRKIRKKAQKEFSATLQNDASSLLLPYVLNMVRKDLSISTKLRKYENKESFRHIANQTTQKSVDAMIDSVNRHFHIVHDYYTIKSSILGYKLKDYDRYAPIFAGVQESKKAESSAKNADAKSASAISSNDMDYESALELVIETYSEFSAPFGEIIKKAAKEGWVSSHPMPNKRGGAFSHGSVPSAHPFVLLNWTGNRRDAFTLAHEFGHAIHQELSKRVGCLNHDTPLTTAETASVFGEMLLFDYLKPRLARKELLGIYAAKLEDIFSTLFRQVVMTNFERAIHASEEELSLQDFDRIWRAENEKMFGKSLKLTKKYNRWWSYIPHFIHSPFYCYAYSFGQLLVLALFGLYKSGKCKNFVALYTQFLSAGGSKSPKELIKSFGFNIEDKEFWAIGLKEVQNMLKEFKTLLDSEGIKYAGKR